MPDDPDMIALPGDPPLRVRLRRSARAQRVSLRVSRLDGQVTLTLPHPLAHLRAFVMVPWLEVEPDAELTVAGRRCPVAGLLAELEPADRDSLRLTELVLHRSGDR